MRWLRQPVKSYSDIGHIMQEALDSLKEYNKAKLTAGHEIEKEYLSAGIVVGARIKFKTNDSDLKDDAFKITKLLRNNIHCESQKTGKRWKIKGYRASQIEVLKIGQS